MLFIGSTFPTITIVPPDARTHTYSLFNVFARFSSTPQVCFFFVLRRHFKSRATCTPTALAMWRCVLSEHAFIGASCKKKVVQQETTDTFKVMRRFALYIFTD